MEFTEAGYQDILPGFKRLLDVLQQDLNNFTEIVLLKAKLIMNRLNYIGFSECILHIVFSLWANS